MNKTQELGEISEINCFFPFARDLIELCGGLTDA